MKSDTNETTVFNSKFLQKNIYTFIVQKSTFVFRYSLRGILLEDFTYKNIAEKYVNPDPGE